MNSKQYVIGVDFGTLSARAIVIDTISGEEISECVSVYKNAILESMPNGEKLPSKFALQNPQDYIDSLGESVKGAMVSGGIVSENVGGIGIDFTSSTVLPVGKDGVPLCFCEKFKNDPHSYVKLWKHHSAQEEADLFTKTAIDRNESFISSYGGKVSCEFMFPKILETLKSSRAVYDSTWRFFEAGDFINFIITGKETHAAAFAGYKAFWNTDSGFPSNEYFKSVDAGLDGIIGTKISERVNGLGEIAGFINENGSAITGLNIGTPVALAMIDAHSAMPALGITDSGRLMMILGTSACHIVNCDEDVKVPGICGHVKNGVIPNTVTYEAGQQSFGDTFGWFVNNFVPEGYTKEAEERNISIHALLREKMINNKVGESGLIALDWFNGNRSVLNNSDLSGAIFGMTIKTKPEAIYRALLEGTAFGTRRIIEQFENSGVKIDSICAAGGIPTKDSFLMQMYSNVLDRKIEIAGTTQAGARGAAIYASVAGGFYDSIVSASKALSVKSSKSYIPERESSEKYQKLYREYCILHDYFAHENDVLTKLSRGEIC